MMKSHRRYDEIESLRWRRLILQIEQQGGYMPKANGLGLFAQLGEHSR